MWYKYILYMYTVLQCNTLDSSTLVLFLTRFRVMKCIASSRWWICNLTFTCTPLLILTPVTREISQIAQVEIVKAVLIISTYACMHARSRVITTKVKSITLLTCVRTAKLCISKIVFFHTFYNSLGFYLDLLWLKISLTCFQNVYELNVLPVLGSYKYSVWMN